MAGSYRHLIDSDGKFTMDFIDNMGDAHEALEDCFNQINILQPAVKALVKNTLCWCKATPRDQRPCGHCMGVAAIAAGKEPADDSVADELLDAMKLMRDGYKDSRALKGSTCLEVCEAAIAAAEKRMSR